MKNSKEWPGWMILEPEDIMKYGDSLCHPGKPDPNLPNVEKVQGYADRAAKVAYGYTVYRKGRIGPKVYVPHQTFGKVLPLP